MASPTVFYMAMTSPTGFTLAMASLTMNFLGDGIAERFFVAMASPTLVSLTMSFLGDGIADRFFRGDGIADFLFVDGNDNTLNPKTLHRNPPFKLGRRVGDATEAHL